ncbi:MAG: PEP-CTERM sorting domain-containing protein [Planctomycetes bacterium]|nr:PEP-CTERM sorting domain-containing protein [Planctomycetota bacterium]
MKHHVAVMVLCSLAVVGSALADDLYPPQWRGLDGSTLAAWEFSTSDVNPAVDLENNPYGPSSMTIWTGVGQQWWPEWEGRLGVWPLSGALEAVLFNRPEPLPFKDIQVQITWRPQVPGGFLTVRETMWGATGELINETPLENEWIHSTFLIRLEPNPAMEIVRLDGSVMVDQIVIDTNCIPEPVTLSLLALGALAMLRRRR